MLGTDGVRKMSKSVGNTIDVLGRAGGHPRSRSCRWSPTRSGSCGPTRAGPRSATSASSSRFFGDDYEELWDGERTARTGCVDTKRLLAERIVARYAEARERYLEL